MNDSHGMIHKRSLTTSELDVSRRSDGKREVSALLVKWDTPADIAEIINGTPVLYTESFARGALSRAVDVPHRVPFQIDHPDPGEHSRGSLDRQAGFGAKFHDSNEGAVGVFTLYPSQAERAVEFLTTSHRWVSVDFVSLAPRRGSEKDGAHVVRQAVHLNAVAATPDPAYVDSAVLAIRSDAALEREVRQQEASQRAAMVDALTFLVQAGGTLTTEHLEWLAGHDIDPAQLGG